MSSKANIGRIKGIVCVNDESHIVQFEARTQKAKLSVGTVYVEGDIGGEFLESIGNICNLLAADNNLDIKHTNIFLTVPAPMDGPSAGLASYLAIYSALTKKPLNPLLSVTGALSDTGAVIAVDDIQKKLYASYRAKLEGVILPMDNMNELNDGMHDFKYNGLVICPVLRTIDALKVAILD